ncbi:UDP-N-acetylglucosamine--LPS N-acetylglucosamine transferase [Phycicoccus endophyticus]|uniref:UDP-N-acetylglucosamine--LPS N-acetylglucosamine transferase n=1 Tax=Phycicoccus endophyticus TaxID=1690220 RepID=A0A7G9R2E8_9MICO|nr:PssD/Cps14F family polysaccharide biosynthesis glycosyltransferase [Phycicoccus endophyticus]NHI20842.1 UDP-N-acetylglucosamine--LPS N-acetylglucosamine transferase [Phycicoccus endophyticus]QNN49773.1 UDP-N-acetylglucosamine--LPS N-acetylglucosamine transferase [Phycicoccus endophyticus]GGL35051.1 UDP-N-acetylglucosamine--LPS N-acetylglucosamine transferase [Phycicoccus endophyticus]
MSEPDVRERPPLAGPGAPARNVLFVCSNGGHLAQLLALQPWYRHQRRTWVTFDQPDAVSRLQDESVVFAHHPTTRNVPNLLRNAVLAWRTLRRVRPDLLVSSGAGVAVPFFVLGRLLGIPTVYIEVLDRVNSRTLTGRLVGPFTTSFLVQWEAQLRLYPKGTVLGRLL